MSGALLAVPPLLKSLAGPLAGPAQLAGVAKEEGAHLHLVDLNAAWLRSFRLGHLVDGPSGDHARPQGGFHAASAAWKLLTTPPPALDDLSHEGVEAVARRIAYGPVGRAWAALLGGGRPEFVGVSVLWSGQVAGAVAVSLLVRERWPGVPVIWGGAHVTALAPEIAADARYGRHIDGFVSGYAEGTVREMLRGNALAAHGVFVAGNGRAARAVEDSGVFPDFPRLHRYGVPRLTLPVQTGRGCAHARCTFCTYPAIEGAYRESDLAALDAVVNRAERLGADVSIKDALVPAPRLDEIAAHIRGRVRWSACTRLVPRLGRERLIRLVEAGLRTLELGVESVDPVVLESVDKRQPPRLVREWLADAAGLDLWLVLNTMSGFPGQTNAEIEAEHQQLRALLRRHPHTRVVLEHNRLQIERRSRLAARAAGLGLSLGPAAAWSSVLPQLDANVDVKEVA